MKAGLAENIDVLTAAGTVHFVVLERAMAGDIAPRSEVARGPLIEACNHGQTQEGCMVGLLERAAGYVADDPAVLSVASTP